MRIPAFTWTRSRGLQFGEEGEGLLEFLLLSSLVTLRGLQFGPLPVAIAEVPFQAELQADGLTLWNKARASDIAVFDKWEAAPFRESPLY